MHLFQKLFAVIKMHCLFTFLLCASVTEKVFANFPGETMYADMGTPIVVNLDENNNIDVDEYDYPSDGNKMRKHNKRELDVGKTVMDMLGIGSTKEETWTGKWFPHTPTTLSPVAKAESVDSLKDPKHGIVMGVSNDQCDNGQLNLELDWDGSPIAHTCYHSNQPLQVDMSLEPLSECFDIPNNYVPQHICMNESVVYNTTLPTHESHRPLWPVFGEYKYVPPQRWLHNVEHGAIVFLYHPCAHPLEVDLMKKMVKSCVWKYIISPYNLLDPKRPLALVAWGCRLQVAYFDPLLVRNFIRHKALRGLEGKYRKNGQYDFGLLEPSQMPEYLYQLDVEEPERDGIVDKVHC